MNRSKLLLALGILGVAAVAAACSEDEMPGTTPVTPVADGGSTPSPGSDASAPVDGSTARDIVATAKANPDFSSLVTLVAAADLEGALQGAGPFTVFAPNNAAFAALPPLVGQKLGTAPYKGELQLLLKYHVVAGAVRAADVAGKTQSVDTLATGTKLAVDGTSGVTLNGTAKVVAADVTASNGVIHGIDKVLLPTIADTAVAYDDGTTTFKTLVAALTAGELVATLAGPGPFTVFAPTDAAFAKLPAGTVADLVKPENKAALQAILRRHVVSGAVLSTGVTAGPLTTLGGNVEVTVSGGNVELNAGGGASKVILTDLPASNGVVHVLDTVILPGT